jgi:hypothetical protein
VRRATWVGIAIFVAGAVAPALSAAPAGAVTRTGGGGGGGGGSNPCVSGNNGKVSSKVTKKVTINGKTYASDPGGLNVNIGQTVSVSISWWSGLFQGTPSQAWDCVFYGQSGKLGGADLGTPPDTFEKPATANPFVTSFTAQSAWAGKTVCDRGLVQGKTNGDMSAWADMGSGTFLSNQFCFFVNPSVRVPETPWAALLLIPGLAISAGVVIVRRRRTAVPAT